MINFQGCREIFNAIRIDGEEQIPVDANHEELCKFPEHENDVYEKIFKRIRRMIIKQDSVSLKSSYNKHYCVPYNLRAAGDEVHLYVVPATNLALPRHGRAKRSLLNSAALLLRRGG